METLEMPCGVAKGDYNDEPVHNERIRQSDCGIEKTYEALRENGLQGQHSSNGQHADPADSAVGRRLSEFIRLVLARLADSARRFGLRHSDVHHFPRLHAWIVFQKQKSQ